LPGGRAEAERWGGGRVVGFPRPLLFGLFLKTAAAYRFPIPEKILVQTFSTNLAVPTRGGSGRLRGDGPGNIREAIGDGKVRLRHEDGEQDHS